MDFSKLNPDELGSFFRMHSVNPKGNVYVIAAELFDRLSPQGPFPEAVVDLYIATQLKRGGLQIPFDYNVDKLNSSEFLEVARIFSLPIQDTPEIRNRAKRIIKFSRPYINIEGVIFTQSNTVGDFNWMIKQPIYQQVLFLFNDNQEQFLDFLNNGNRGTGCLSGSGNAVIRPYQCLNPPRAAGIPTGVNQQGYKSLTQAQPYIDAAINRIQQLLQTGNYNRVMFSAANDGQSLGTSIFSPSEEVKVYIVNRIRGLNPFR